MATFPQHTELPEPMLTLFKHVVLVFIHKGSYGKLAEYKTDENFIQYFAVVIRYIHFVLKHRYVYLKSTHFSFMGISGITIFKKSSKY